MATVVVELDRDPAERRRGNDGLDAHDCTGGL
jgi:hypothetical protein